MQAVEDADRDVQPAMLRTKRVHSQHDLVRDPGSGVLEPRLP